MKKKNTVLSHFKVCAPASDVTLMAFHDGDGWCIKAERRGCKPFIFGCYAETAKDAQWAAEQVAQSIGAVAQPLQLN